MSAGRPILVQQGVATVTALAATLALAACGGGSSGTSSSTSGPSVSSASVLPGGGRDTSSSASATTLSRPPSATRSSAGSVREIDRACPYVSNEEVALTEGNRVGRSTVVTTAPVGCRFYFAFGDGHMTAQIAVRTYATATLAYNAMVRTGGRKAIGDPSLADGAVLYQTSFYPPDGARDWACTFAKGRRVVTVNTSQVSPSANARNLAAHVAPMIR
ncbi:MAG: hypothetical protein ABJA87_03960 [bacterium]